MFVRICNGVQDKGKLVAEDTVYDHITDNERDWYMSVFKYSDAHVARFKELGTVAGINDVTTSTLLFDLDDKENPERARADALTLVERLQTHGFPSDALKVFWSGNKGFHVEVETDRTFTPSEARSICLNVIGKGLETLDSTVYNANRIIRIPGTRHKESGLYKSPLTLVDLASSTIASIKAKASRPPEGDWEWTVASVPLPVLSAAAERPKTLAIKLPGSEDYSDVDFTNKVKGWSNCKWALASGVFRDGVRNQALTAVVATSKALNYTKDQAYHMAKSAAGQSAVRFGGEKYPKDHIWKIVESVYSPTWRGGSYSCKDGKSPWLTETCNSLGKHKCSDSAAPVVTTSEVFSMFEDYAKNYDKNCIKTGIDALDEKCNFMVGTSNGIVAAPGAGKTSMSLYLLHHNSQQGIPSIFFSYDMFHSMLYLRLVQKHTGWSQQKIFDAVRGNKKEADRIRDMLSNEYKNVSFCFKSGQTADEIQETILDTEQKIGNKLKLAIVDYNELVITPNVSDPTQSSAQVAQKLRAIANETSVCAITLLQPSKMYSNPADEFNTYQAAKGSGAIAQSMSLMLGLSRPGFSPRNPQNDQFITINALKNRQGGLFTLDLGWEGLTGNITELSSEQEWELNRIREEREAEREASGNGGWQ